MKMNRQYADMVSSFFDELDAGQTLAGAMSDLTATYLMNPLFGPPWLDNQTQEDGPPLLTNAPPMGNIRVFSDAYYWDSSELKYEPWDCALTKGNLPFTN
jgi:hypothetical protein